MNESDKTRYFYVLVIRMNKGIFLCKNVHDENQGKECERKS